MHGKFVLIMSNSAFALLGIVTSGHCREGIKSPVKTRKHVWNGLVHDAHTREPTKEALYSCNLGWGKVCIKGTTYAQVLRVWDKCSKRERGHQMVDAQV